MKLNVKKVLLFIGSTYFFSYLLIMLYFALGGQWMMPGNLLVSTLYMFIPMFAAFAVQNVYKEPFKELSGTVFTFNRWFLAGWLLPAAIAFAALGVGLFLPGVQFSPGMEGMFGKFKGSFTQEQIDLMKTLMASLPVHPIWIGLVQGLIAGATIKTIAAFGEEIGWRGFLLKELNFMGFWTSSSLIGIASGLWYAPLILQGLNYPQHPKLGVLMMLLFAMLWSPILSYIRIKAKSVTAAAVTHGTLNATMGIAVMVLSGGNDLTVGATGLAGLIVLAIVNLMLFFYDRYYF